MSKQPREETVDGRAVDDDNVDAERFSMGGGLGGARGRRARPARLLRSVQLNATESSPSRAGRTRTTAGRPCIHEDFFNFPAGFEGMGVADKRRSDWRRIDPFNQCRSRTRDEHWPTAELIEVRTPSTRTMADVMPLLGRRVVTLVGASVMCATSRHAVRPRDRPPPPKYELQWARWGWGTFTADGGGCTPRRAPASASPPASPSASLSASPHLTLALTLTLTLALALTLTLTSPGARAERHLPGSRRPRESRAARRSPQP